MKKTKFFLYFFYYAVVGLIVGVICLTENLVSVLLFLISLSLAVISYYIPYKIAIGDWK